MERKSYLVPTASFRRKDSLGPTATTTEFGSVGQGASNLQTTSWTCKLSLPLHNPRAQDIARAGERRRRRRVLLYDRISRARLPAPAPWRLIHSDHSNNSTDIRGIDGRRLDGRGFGYECLGYTVT